MSDPVTATPIATPTPTAPATTTEGAVEGQAVVQQTQTETPKPDLKSRLAQAAELNKRAAHEREVRELKRKLQEREEDQEYKRFLELKKNPNRNPLDVLKEFEINMDDVTERLVKGEEAPRKKTELETLQEKFDSLQKRLDEREQTNASKEQQQAVEQYKNQLKAHIASNEKFEIMASLGDEAIDKAYETMIEFWKQTNETTGKGEVLSFDELCEHVEAEMAETIEAKFDRLSKLKKFQNKFGKPSEPQAQPGQANQTAASSAPTLTTQMVRSTNVEQGHIRDDRQALLEAASLLRFKP